MFSVRCCFFHSPRLLCWRQGYVCTYSAKDRYISFYLFSSSIPFSGVAIVATYVALLWTTEERSHKDQPRTSQPTNQPSEVFRRKLHEKCHGTVDNLNEQFSWFKLHKKLDPHDTCNLSSNTHHQPTTICFVSSWLDVTY